MTVAARITGNRKTYARTAFYAGCVAVFGLWLHFSGLGTIRDLQRSLEEESQLEQEIQTLEQSNSALVDDIQDLESNGLRVEELARQKLGLAREGEIVVKIPEKK